VPGVFKERRPTCRCRRSRTRTAAFVAAVAVTFTNVWIIADDATPPSDALVVLAARGH